MKTAFKVGFFDYVIEPKETGGHMLFLATDKRKPILIFGQNDVTTGDTGRKIGMICKVMSCFRFITEEDIEVRGHISVVQVNRSKTTEDALAELRESIARHYLSFNIFPKV